MRVFPLSRLKRSPLRFLTAQFLGWYWPLHSVRQPKQQG
ncbi:Uncharacterised protein [Vibrio cholerae]|nr:Uncharacterised protein [Vibrio cholerae]